MQGETIVLAAGQVAGGLGIAQPEFTLNRVTAEVTRSQYEFASTHTLLARDILQLYRTFPKRSGNSRGAAKVAMKITTDISVANADGSGNIVLPLIGEVSFSLPVGVTDSQIRILLGRIGKLTNAVPTAPEGKVDPMAVDLCEKLHIS